MKCQLSQYDACAEKKAGNMYNFVKKQNGKRWHKIMWDDINRNKKLLWISWSLRFDFTVDLWVNFNLNTIVCIFTLNMYSKKQNAYDRTVVHFLVLFRTVFYTNWLSESRLTLKDYANFSCILFSLTEYVLHVKHFKSYWKLYIRESIWSYK